MLRHVNGDTEMPEVRRVDKRFAKGEEHLNRQGDTLQRKTSHWKNLRCLS